jgi:protein transport protein SEC24
MPERLKEFAMYMLGLLKCRAFKGGNESSDRRVHEMRLIRSMGALELSLYLYPRMIPLHNLQPEDGFPDPANGGHLRLPPCIRASFSRVEPGGVYLVDNGQQTLLWMHAQTSPNLIADLFGEGKDSLGALDAYTSALPVLQTHLNAQVRNVIEWLRTMRGSKGLTLQLARQGIDGAEYEFARMLVEDRNNEAQSYVDWLVAVHKGVQLEVSLFLLLLLSLLMTLWFLPEWRWLMSMMMQLAGQRKREDTSDSALSSFSGLRPSYW